MRRLILAVALVLGALVGDALGADLSWDAMSGATSYDVEQSTDAGATWVLVKNVLASACSAGRCGTVVTPAASGFTLYRVGSRNAAGAMQRFDAGSWACPSCLPPSAPSNVGLR